MQDTKKDKYLQKKYGITLSAYNQMLVEQHDSCALCKKHKSHFKRALHVDHNHKSGIVRGLVCFYCNNQLIRKHNMKTAESLYEYMKKYDAKS